MINSIYKKKKKSVEKEIIKTTVTIMLNQVNWICIALIQTEI